MTGTKTKVLQEEELVEIRGVHGSAAFVRQTEWQRKESLKDCLLRSVRTIRPGEEFEIVFSPEEQARFDEACQTLVGDNSRRIVLAIVANLITSPSDFDHDGIFDIDEGRLIYRVSRSQPACVTA